MTSRLTTISIALAFLVVPLAAHADEPNVPPATPTTSTPVAAVSTRTDDPVLAESLPLAMSALNGVRYSRAFDPALPHGHANEVAFDSRTRLWLGRSLAYVAGLDASIGGGETGLVYELEAHLVGVGLRWETGAIGVSSGFGFGGVVGSVPFAWQVPVEAHVEASLGPIRVLVTAGARFVLGSDARQDGAHLVDFADEVSGSLYVRLGREHHYWGHTVAGQGPALGVVYRERMGSRMLGVVLALGLSGGR